MGAMNRSRRRKEAAPRRESLPGARQLQLTSAKIAPDASAFEHSVLEEARKFAE